MKIYLLIVLLLCSYYNVLAQNITENSQKREAQYGIEYANYWRNDVVCDTLFLEEDRLTVALPEPKI